MPDLSALRRPRVQPRSLPSVFARAQLAADPDFVARALGMCAQSARSPVPYWDPRVFLAHRVACRLLAGGDSCSGRLRARKLSALLAWLQRPIVVSAPRERLAAAWSAPWSRAVPLDHLLALGSCGCFVALGPGFSPTALQDERLDPWLEGLFVCLDEGPAADQRAFDLTVVLLSFDLREGLVDLSACIPLGHGTLAAARCRRLDECRRAGAPVDDVAALPLGTAMRVVALLVDLVAEVNHSAIDRRLALTRLAG